MLNMLEQPQQIIRNTRSWAALRKFVVLSTQASKQQQQAAASSSKQQQAAGKQQARSKQASKQAAFAPLKE